MVLGTTYYNAARSAADPARNRSGSLRAFRNACLAVLAIVGAVVAGDPASSAKPGCQPKKDSDTPAYLPPLASSNRESIPPTLPQPESVEKSKNAAEAKSPNSVLLPPIQSPINNGDMAPPSYGPALSPYKSGRLPSPSLLEPPPDVNPPRKPALESTLEVIVGQTRVLTFPDIPHRVALAVNESDPIASLQEVPHRPCEWYLIGKKPGNTFLDVWLPDPTSDTSNRVLHYSVRIRGEVKKQEVKITQQKPPAQKPQPPKPPTEILLPQPQTRQAERPQPRTPIPEPIYQTLEQEINRTFPGNAVHLKQVGEMLVVSGTARNIFEATRILTIARENAPGARSAVPNRMPPASPSLQATIDNYAHIGGAHVVNLLRIPGEQQIMLRVVVAEVNRAAARSLGLDFGIGDKQAAILPNRAGLNGSSTVAGNGWIGQVLRTLQDLHYAQSLAEPTLTTLNGKAARFQAGGEFPIPVVTPSPQWSGAERRLPLLRRAVEPPAGRRRCSSHPLGCGCGSERHRFASHRSGGRHRCTGIEGPQFPVHGGVERRRDVGGRRSDPQSRQRHAVAERPAWLRRCRVVRSGTGGVDFPAAAASALERAHGRSRIR